MTAHDILWNDEQDLQGKTHYVARFRPEALPLCSLERIGFNKWAMLHAGGGTALTGNLEQAKCLAEGMLGL